MTSDINVSISRDRKLYGARIFRMLVMILLFTTPLTRGAWAQLETGSILGVVQDSTGAAITHAHVQVINTQTGATSDITADNHGNYVAPVLQLGSYRVTADAKGFKQTAVEGVSLTAGERKRVDVQLTPGAVGETVNVTSSTPLLQSASSELGDVISTKEVHDLPLNGRDVTSTLALLPGLSGANTNYFQSAIAYTVDGTDASQIDSGFSGAAYNSQQRLTRTSLDAVQEVQVQTSNFSAEWGSSNGAIFNIVTKSGTNQFHGSAFEYVRNAAMDARNYFNAAPLVKPEDTLNQFGGSFGGPIKRDRIFFFGNYEGIRQASGVTFYNVLVPTPTFDATLPAVLQPIAAQIPMYNGGVSSDPRLGFYNTTTANNLTENSGSAKVDFQITKNDKLSVRWNGNQSDTLAPFGVAQGQSRDVPGLLQTARVSYTKLITPNIYNEASVAMNRVRYNDNPSNDPTIRAQPLIFSLGNGATGTGPALFDIRVANTSFTYLDTLSVVKGKNQFKFGVQFIRDQQNKELNFQGNITFNTLDQFAANSPVQISTLGYPMTGVRLLYSNGFIQDDLQVTPNLTVNAGIRYTYDTAPGEAHNRQRNYNATTGMLDPAGTSVTSMPAGEFAPRIGFAYRLGSDGKSVIRGAFGVFYNDINVAQAQEFVDNYLGQNRTLTSIQDPTLTAFPFNTDLPATAVSNIWGLPQNWSNSRSLQWNLAVQHQFGQKISAQVAYVGNQSIHLSPAKDINEINPATASRPNPNFGTINVYIPCCGANYNGLQATYKQQFMKGLSWNVNYAYSRSMDYGNSTFGSSFWMNQDNLLGEYGPADYDQRHYFESDFLYQAPKVYGLPKVVGAGWQINGILTAHSGTPYTVICGCSTPTDDGTNRPVLNPGVNPHVSNPNPPNGPQLNLAAFSQPAPGTYGNVGRNSMYGPHFVNFDTSLFKNFAIVRSMVLQVRFEAFNVFNHPNFTNPDANTGGDPNFGKSLGTVNTNRQLQAAVRLDF